MSASTSPLPYTGNKSCIVNTILSVMPKHTVYIDPCMGSAEVFFRKPRAEKEILNDYNGDLVNLFRVIQNNEKLAYLLGRLYLSINGELAFKQNKDRLKGVPNILDDVIETSQIFYDASWEDIQNAAAFLENQVYSFSSTGQTFGIARRDMSQRLPRLMSAYNRIRDAIILHRDYKDVITYAACPGSFILLDPPYKGTEDMYSKANFDIEQHDILFSFMSEVNQQHHGEVKFLITYNNDPYIRGVAEKHGFDTFVQTRLHSMKQSKEAGALYPEEKESFFEALTQEDVDEFLATGTEDCTGLPELKEMTANDFYRFCALGYAANNYDGQAFALKAQYYRHADGRDDGLKKIDPDSAEAFADWLENREKGGHPWEVCRGGNSTHVSLYVGLGRVAEGCYHLALAAKSYGRCVVAIKFYLALKHAGLPVIIYGAEFIKKRLLGLERVGIVPNEVMPFYCHSRFPGEDVDSFRHLNHENPDAEIALIEWQPIKPVKLKENAHE